MELCGTCNRGEPTRVPFSWRFSLAKVLLGLVWILLDVGQTCLAQNLLDPTTQLAQPKTIDWHAMPNSEAAADALAFSINQSSEPDPIAFDVLSERPWESRTQSPAGEPRYFWFDAADLGYQNTAWVGQIGELDVRVWGVARAALRSDQRYQFTGLETTFLTEGQMLADIRHSCDGWSYGALLEGYFNQRYDRNVLADYPLRESFQHNFDVDTLEISQAFLNIRRGDWALDAGKFATPFGRYYGGQYVNNRSDAPFLRTESILFRETGLQIRYEPSIWRLALAITNGSQDGDTNSSKAVVSRLGWDRGQWAGGASVKWQDGIGSEGHKQFNNHAGIDLAWKSGRWLCWGECIYDQYGTRRPGLDLDDITWGRSLYNRQINRGPRQPLTGVGWYVQMIRNDRWGATQLGYGEFHPEFVGDSIHDQITRRGLLKRNWMITTHLEWFVFGTLENQVENAQDGRLRSGLAYGTGLSFHF